MQSDSINEPRSLFAFFYSLVQQLVTESNVALIY